MKEFICGDKKFLYPESWQEMTLKVYIRVAKVQETISDYKMGELYLLNLIEAICDAETGELDELTIPEINEIAVNIAYLQETPQYKVNKELTIGDILYTCPDDLKTLSIGEYISLKTYQESGKGVWEIAPYLLAILWRPTILQFNDEKGKNEFIREKFKLENLEFRKELFLEQPAMKLIGSILFFSTMTNGYMSST